MRAPRLAGRLRGELDHHEVEEVLDEGVTAFVGRLSSRSVAQVHGALNDDAFSTRPARGCVPLRRPGSAMTTDRSCGQRHQEGKLNP